MKIREQISSWIMLSVFLPMLLISSFHIHVESLEVIDCDDCAGLVHHSGHITSQASSIDDCLLCRFLSQTFDCSQVHPEQANPNRVIAILSEMVWLQSMQDDGIVLSLRAPPHIL